MATLLMALLAVPLAAWAVEYRLRVVSVYEEAFSALLRPNELVDGASGPGLDQLEASLDRGEFPMGAILWDRPLQTVSGEAAARAYGAVVVRPDLPEAGARQLWHELRWEGRPGEQTVWKVSPSGLRVGELDRVALRGRGLLRQFLPFVASTNGRRGHALSVPLLYLWAQEERGIVWPGYLSRALELSDEIAAVVGVNTNRSFADQVYLLVRHGEQPTTYKAVLSWRPRDRSHLNDLEAPGGGRTR
ncbi:MAG: hypothetical protein ACREK6_01150 [Candidatus Rokuibacteriota bacterium]